ncbi:MAG: carboxyltransferase domain-containing protein [Blastomonas sp.]
MTIAGKRFETDDHILFRELDRQRIEYLYRIAKAQTVWQEVVPGIDSLALQYDPASIDREEIERLIVELLTGDGQPEPNASAPETVTLPICYAAEFGPDQAMIAERLGMTIGDLPEWHASRDWHVAMLGFLPGFAYLACDEDIPAIPRLADPRARLAAGSVGLLGDQCGLYALPGPGGWPIIGRVVTRLFDPHATPPALLRAGMCVRFQPLSRQEYDALTTGKRA